VKTYHFPSDLSAQFHPLFLRLGPEHFLNHLIKPSDEGHEVDEGLVGGGGGVGRHSSSEIGVADEYLANWQEKMKGSEVGKIL